MVVNMERCWCGNSKLKDYSDEYYQCDECHTLVFKRTLQKDLYEIRSEQEDLYGGNYWEKFMAEKSGKNTLGEMVDLYLSERAVYWIKYILKHVSLQGGGIAEVGCGLGQLQYLLKRLEYNQMAFELSPYICEYMEKTLQIRTHCGPFVENKKAYDGILAFDLFEHLTEPLLFVEQCANSLKEDGVLCFQTPCYDPELSYEEMKASKSRFQQQLLPYQHIYLYSRESITEILMKYGFEHVIFEPAFFGADYDMFLFTSKHPVRINSEKEIDDFLNSKDNGRLVKAMITLFDGRQDMTAKYQAADADRITRQEQINELTQILKESEADRAARQEQIDQLTQILKESEADRAARQEQINELTQILKESEADRAARQEQIDQLTQWLKESEADRAARQEQIDQLLEQKYIGGGGTSEDEDCD